MGTTAIANPAPGAMASWHVRLAPLAGPDWQHALFRSLEQHNAAFVGPADPRPLAVMLDDGSDAFRGGLWGRTMYRWLSIQMLFVPPAQRGLGHGRGLVRMAEREAAARGCLGALVDTFGFQARGFYESLGYQVFGTLQDLPPGSCCHYLCRRFAALPTPPEGPSESRPADAARSG
jgi:GNAT superfamily N-acetyltransferase